MANGGFERVVAERAPPAVLLFWRGRPTTQSLDGDVATDELAAFRRRRAPRPADIDAIGAVCLSDLLRSWPIRTEFAELDRRGDPGPLGRRQPGVCQAAVVDAGDGGRNFKGRCGDSTGKAGSRNCVQHMDGLSICGSGVHAPRAAVMSPLSLNPLIPVVRATKAPDGEGCSGEKKAPVLGRLARPFERVCWRPAGGPSLHL